MYVRYQNNAAAQALDVISMNEGYKRRGLRQGCDRPKRKRLVMGVGKAKLPAVTWFLTAPDWRRRTLPARNNQYPGLIGNTHQLTLLGANV